ncbi:hypothetical protein K1719_005095 [Acacia pycnantha]|nr:hypothetical protein K1719_005095 [Acacia pycnantha]
MARALSDTALDISNKDDCHPPSPTAVCTEADLLPSMLKRLSELEEKVDALEAELIATKKALYEALMRQEELAYFRSFILQPFNQKMKFCW